MIRYHTPLRPQPADYRAAMAWWDKLRRSNQRAARDLAVNHGMRSCVQIARYHARWVR